MKRLRLTQNEEQALMKYLSSKFNNCNKNITMFNITHKDIDDFLNELDKEKTIAYPTIGITSDAYVKMYELVKQSSTEIQWHGLVKRAKNVYLIHDILVFPQTNSTTSTSSDQEAFTKWQTDLVMDMDFPIEELRMHGHSHVNMNVFSSSIDDGYQSELITKVDDGDFYIFLVLNKKMEMYALLYDFDQQILFEGKDIKIKIYDKEAIDIREWCANQIKVNCKTSKPTTYSKSPKTNFEIEEYDYEESYISNLISPRRKFLNRR